MHTIRSGRYVALLLALGAPMLFPVARAAGSDAAGAQPDATVVEFADFHQQTGKHPGGVILAGDGNYYGTTLAGGRHGQGTIFRVDPDGAVTSLYDFKGEADGRQPEGALVQGADGALYGVAQGSIDPNWNNANGVIFRVSLDGRFEAIHTMAADGSEGFSLNTPLIQGRDGKLYGTARYDPAYMGLVYSVTPDGQYATVARFLPGQFGQPWAPPLQADDDHFYLTTTVGGSRNYGGLLLVSRKNGTVTVLHDFTNQGDGAYPQGPLVFDAARESVWGVTYKCVYRYRIESGVLGTVACLGKDWPGAVTLGPDGTHFYVVGQDKVHSIAPDGTLQTIARLPSRSSLFQQMILDPAGALVGTTTKSGAKDAGTVFKIEGY